MTKIYTVFISGILILLTTASYSRDFYNEIIKPNLKTTKYAIDTEAGAVVLYEKTTVLTTYENYMYRQKESVHRIIKILKSNAEGLGNIHIHYAKDDYLNYVDHVNAVTYNTSGDDTVTSSVGKKDLYKKHVFGNSYELSFSMPSIKEGSIIEYSYELYRDFPDLEVSWNVQGRYPKLVSYFTVNYPSTIAFVAVSHVRAVENEHASIEEAEASPDGFCRVKDKQSFYTEFAWIRKNIPAIKQEPYVGNIDNYMERLEVQITSIGTRLGAFDFANSWDKFNDEFWKKHGWGKLLSARNNFMADAVDSIVRQFSDSVGRAHAIFSYVRSHFKCNKDPLDLEVNLKENFAYNEGNEMEINFILTAMLIRAGFDASPVFISTTGHIPLSNVFPIRSRVNYVACAVKIDTGYLFLDASDKAYAFGQLPTACYNGFAWVLGDPGMGTQLTAGQLQDRTVTGIKVSDFTDSTARMEITEKHGMVRSQLLRTEWEHDDEAQKKYITKQEETLPESIRVQSSEVQNLDDADANLVIRYKCTVHFERKTARFLLSTGLWGMFTENPFKSTVRQLPVEFPFRYENLNVINVMLPPDMEPDSIAKPAIVDFENGSMTFKKTGAYYPEMHTATFNSTFAVNTTNYGTSYYETLREFFQSVIDEGSRVITIKRKMQ